MAVTGYSVGGALCFGIHYFVGLSGFFRQGLSYQSGSYHPLALWGLHSYHADSYRLYAHVSVGVQGVTSSGLRCAHVLGSRHVRAFLVW